MLDFNGFSVGLSAVKLLDVVPGGRTIVISNSSSTNEVFLGSSSGVTATNGFPLGGGSNLVIPPSVAGTQVWCIGNVAGPTAVGVMVGDST